eukprot:TRINITY_DN2783_c0_g1_i3.p2 TRINITY_DN2783_c0_g1~~TRINITY_DN2783_c0_g1_i3.p2  ORF type:complete len:118 (-),score=21.46 TRINITY_DN2783_c0_g1_i3:36-389(-)
MLDSKSDQTKDLSLSWHQKVSADSKFAFNYTLNSAPGVSPLCSIAGEHNVDSATTVRGKLNVVKPKDGVSNLRFGFGVVQKLSDHATGTIGADLNASSLLGGSGGNPHSFGYELKLK